MLRDLDEVEPNGRDQLLVRGNHRLAGFERGRDQLVRRVDAPHHLDDDIEIGIEHDAHRIRREHLRGELRVARLGRIPHRDAPDGNAHAGAGRDRVGMIVEQPHQRGTDVPATQQAYPDGAGHRFHKLSLALRQTPSRRTRSANVSRRTTTRGTPARTKTTAGRGSRL